MMGAALGKQALCRPKFNVRWKPFEDGPLDGEETLVRVAYCGICGSDVHDVSSGFGDWQALGHEMVGTVEKVGTGVRGIDQGMSVAVRNAASCGTCERCLAGQGRYCESVHVCLGGFSTHLKAPAQVLMPLGDLSLSDAVLIEPLNVAIDLVRTAEVQNGEPVVIVGPGPIGILAACVCRLWHRSPLWIIGHKTSAKRLELLRRLSFEDYFDVSKKGWKSEAASSFASMAHLKFLVTAPPVSIVDSLEKIAPFGSSFTTVGLAHHPKGESIAIKVRPWMFKRFQLRTSFAYPNLYFDEAIKIIGGGCIPAGEMITQVFPLDKLKGALRFVADRGPDLIKAVVSCRDSVF